MSTESDDSGASDGDSTSSSSSEGSQPLPAEMKAVDTNVMDQDSVRGSAFPDGTEYYRGS